VREWLDRNKVYFETVATVFSGISAVVVGVVAILVSLQANQIAAETNKITSQQAQLIEAEYLPVFDIQTDSTGTEEFLTITNVGAPISHFNHDLLSFYAFTYQDYRQEGSSEGSPRHASVPIDGYFGGSFVIDELTGLLAYTQSEENLARAEELQTEFEKYGARAFSVFLDVAEPGCLEVILSFDVARRSSSSNRLVSN
jgi:hypothetical protein